MGDRARIFVGARAIGNLLRFLHRRDAAPIVRQRFLAAMRGVGEKEPIRRAMFGVAAATAFGDANKAEGFKLAGKSEINANPKDTKDYAEGVWTLPPSFRAKNDATDHAKYAAIGESDRMTLKFVKLGKKPEAKTAAAPKI